MLLQYWKIALTFYFWALNHFTVRCVRRLRCCCYFFLLKSLFLTDWCQQIRLQDYINNRLGWLLGYGYSLDIVDIGVTDVPKEFDFKKFIGDDYDENFDISALVVIPSRDTTLLLDIRIGTIGRDWEELQNNNPFQLDSLELFDFEE